MHDRCFFFELTPRGITLFIVTVFFEYLYKPKRKVVKIQNLHFSINEETLISPPFDKKDK